MNASSIVNIIATIKETPPLFPIDLIAEVDQVLIYVSLCCGAKFSEPVWIPIPFLSQLFQDKFLGPGTFPGLYDFQGTFQN